MPALPHACCADARHTALLCYGLLHTHFVPSLPSSKASYALLRPETAQHSTACKQALLRQLVLQGNISQPTNGVTAAVWYATVSHPRQVSHPRRSEGYEAPSSLFRPPTRQPALTSMPYTLPARSCGGAQPARQQLDSSLATSAAPSCLTRGCASSTCCSCTKPRAA